MEIRKRKINSNNDNLGLNLEQMSAKSILDQLNNFAKENETHVNYLIENGLQTVLASRSNNI